jgi:hypothetical protein
LLLPLPPSSAGESLTVSPCSIDVIPGFDRAALSSLVNLRKRGFSSTFQ